MATILVIDDEPSICWGLSELGKRLKHDVLSASSAEVGLEIARRQRLDLVLLDVRLPGMDGVTALPRLKELAPATPVVVMTAHGDLSTAVDVVRHGAFDYVAKPFDLTQIERVIERSLTEEPATASPRGVSADADGIIGHTPVMQEVFKRIALVAPSNACVMVGGESGTGKELVARAIHRYSRRSNGPFVAVNVAALSPTLAESELFGHVRGSFTGADQTRSGLLVEADGGTLFLDEVADIPLPVQVKLLRALEQGEVLPVGSGRAVRTNFRLLTATHQDLIAKTRSGEFRHDLYYRLATFQIELPPLRERRDDVPKLVDYFVQRLAEGRTVRVSHEALRELQSRDWHGNVRELRGALEHALVLAREAVILPEHLPPPLAPHREIAISAADELTATERLREMIRKWTEERLKAGDSPTALYEELLALVEPPFLRAALQEFNGQCAAAARIVGLHRTTLKKKLDQYGIEGKE